MAHTSESNGYLNDIGEGVVVALRAVRDASDAFPPLKSAAGVILVMLDVVQVA
jgi:hypothetical protein